MVSTCRTDGKERNVRSTFVLALVGYLLASPVPATAQEQVSISTTRGDWSHVLKLRPGTQITVMMTGFQPVRRSVVVAEASQLTVLNLTDPMRPRSVTRALLDIALKHPEAFTSLQAGRFVERDVSVGSDGVFLHDRKIAELRDIAETIARHDVAEIMARRKGGGILGHLGPIGGFFAGGLAGGYIGALVCRCDSGFLPGMLAGGIAGGVAGYRAAVGEREHLIYRAP